MLRFVFQSVVLGLAVAFVVLLVEPRLRPPSLVVLHEGGSTGTITQGPVSYADAVTKAAPAVVNINTATVRVYRTSPFGNDPFFGQLFGSLMGQTHRRLETSLGSGVIVSSSGLILTNDHVIKGAQAIEVFLKDGRHAVASVVGADPASDLAVLRIQMTHLPVITFGDSKDLRIGDVVLAIGDPFGVGQTVTMGIVSATGRNELGLSPFDNFIQTDAAINPGNSGGALINTNGEVIGINSAIFTQSGGYQGIGFAIPIDLAKDVLEQIVKHGHVIRGWLGLEGQNLTPELADALGVKQTTGVIVAGVLRGGPADVAGIRPGDIIASIHDQPITSANQALQIISAQKPGTLVPLEIVRKGRRFTVTARAINRPSQIDQPQNGNPKLQ